MKRRDHGNLLQPCLLTAKSASLRVCIPHRPRGVPEAQALPPSCPLASLLVALPRVTCLFSQTLGFFLCFHALARVPSALPLLIYLQPCSKMRFQSHLLHAVFLDLQCDVGQSLLWTSESPDLSFCPPLLGTSFILPPRWFSLLLKWKLSERRGHVTDSTLYPQGSTQELVCFQCRCKGGKGRDGRHRLTEPWTHVSMFWPQYLLTRRTPLGWGYKKISPGTSLVIQWLRLCSQCREPRVNPWLGN